MIYTKGNIDLFSQKSIAIVGARNSSEKGLEFTANIAKKAVADNKVVVSGFAKGVDKLALDSALAEGGKSIVVLPQGIDTYKSKAYYQNIMSGDVLIVSTYPPKAGWSVGLAMGRNKYIYGLAYEIYVAESSAKGGTWSGVVEGLNRIRKKKERKEKGHETIQSIYVRYPEKDEKNANILLIEKGAIPVDNKGIILKDIKLKKTKEKGNQQGKFNL